MDDDEVQEIVQEDTLVRGGERCIQVSFSGLVRIPKKFGQKRRFIDSVQKFVVNNSEISVRLSIIMNLIVMICVRDNVLLPDNFCSREFVDQASNWSNWRTTPHPLILQAIDIYGDFEPSFNNLEGKSWLLGYIGVMYTGHIIASTKGKWEAFIEDSIKTYLRMFMQDATEQRRNRTKWELRRQICSPTKPRPNTAPNLDQNALDLVEFHRQGFGVWGTDQHITRGFINASLGEHHSRYILHFGHCMWREENMENEWNVEGIAHDDRIFVKKRLPLPFFSIGSRKAIQIDKRGMYWILKEFGRSGGNLHGVGAPTWSTQLHKFTAVNYRQWMRYMFRVDEILESKPFKERGVGITTNAVCASVHFIASIVESDDEEEMHRSVQALSLSSDDAETNGNSDSTDADEEEEMLRSVQALSLTPHEDDNVEDEGK
jgi:hypothetical protein